MSALTYEIKDPRSPVAVWLRERFPHHREVQTAFRAGAGPILVPPPAGAVLGTQGGAIDWWLRFLIDPAPRLELALAGLTRHRGRPFVKPGLRLLAQVGVIEPGSATVAAMDPTRVADLPDEWWARLSYALALLVEGARMAPAGVEHSRLMLLSPPSSPRELLDLCTDAEVADLIAMRDLARERLLPALPPGPVHTGMTFEGSHDLNADADLIAAGVLVDFKASQGGNPRQNGTRAASLPHADLDQLLGYALMDYSDAFALHSLAIYSTRFGYLASWPIDQLTAQLAGGPLDLALLRREFANILKVELPAYWSQKR
ncbi:hypothetical protein [Kineosporia sp. NBRC 101731]|uniref:hypothetical protein n=1 Tax=Kineosporia sp. NBRC 101731 TaxID=3032199 RepID=UPI0025571A78|nr:hypothetical protein [Kineosporia sp. NBRC 101731]